MTCYFCKAPDTTTTVIVNGKKEKVCWACYKEHKNDDIERRLNYINNTSDFKNWEMRDMSEAFWIHLGKYQKNPNKKSLNIMCMAYGWACHADHGLSNSFRHALDWCGIKFSKENKRTDLADE